MHLFVSLFACLLALLLACSLACLLSCLLSCLLALLLALLLACLLAWVEAIFELKSVLSKIDRSDPTGFWFWVSIQSGFGLCVLLPHFEDALRRFCTSSPEAEVGKRFARSLRPKLKAETCFPFHGCCWETFYIFAYCGLVGDPHLTTKIDIVAPLPTSTKFHTANLELVADLNHQQTKPYWQGFLFVSLLPHFYLCVEQNHCWMKVDGANPTWFSHACPKGIVSSTSCIFNRACHIS